MRVVGYIEHPVLKITLFQMHNKYSVKFETDLLEQTFKFRTGDAIENLQDVRALVDAEFISRVEADFERMRNTQQAAFQRFLSKEEGSEFDEII